MERPVNLPEDIYALIIESSEELDTSELCTELLKYGYIFDITIDTSSINALLETIFSNPAPYLYQKLHILSRADLLENLFIEFEDDEMDSGLTYRIDKQAAEAIASGKEDIQLQILYEGGEALISRSRIEEAFKKGCTLDYQESKKK